MIMQLVLKYAASDPPFRNRIAQNAGYLIVDEYQDVNPIQEKIVRTLYDLGANVCVVGDDDQTIFQWRGSDIRFIHEFSQRYDNVHSVTLADNFRSFHCGCGIEMHHQQPNCGSRKAWKPGVFSAIPKATFCTTVSSMWTKRISSLWKPDVVTLKLKPEKQWVLKSIFAYNPYDGKRTGNKEYFKTFDDSRFHSESYGVISALDDSLKETIAEVLMLHLEKG